MRVYRNWTGIRGIKDPIVTLGNFDGIHVGHAKILRKVRERALMHGSTSVVYTFDPHPLTVVAPHKSPALILDGADKKAVIAGYGIDCLILARFTPEFALTHPREFVKDVLVSGLRAKEVWVGSNFAFGKNKAGDVDYLRSLGAELGFKVFVIPPYKKTGGIVSSSRVRELLKDGEVGKAAALLGRGYHIKGRVVKGRNIGAAIGFPTANLKTDSEIIPKNGVYAAYAQTDGGRYRAVVNIGNAPTFKDGRGTAVEAHLLGFKKKIYGRKMTLVFLKRLRDELAFESKEALVKQIKKDVERAKRFF